MSRQVELERRKAERRSPVGQARVTVPEDGEVVTDLEHQRRPRMTTQELIELTQAQEEAARDQVDEQVDRLRRTAPDPWKHRSEGMKCSTCMWYVAKNGPANGQEIGRCRRRAPTMAGYPVVFPVDWCGDHKLSEVRT